MFGFVFLMIQGIAEVIKTIEYIRGHEYRYESDGPALAGGQTFEVDDFDVEAGQVLLADEQRSGSAEGGDR